MHTLGEDFALEGRLRPSAEVSECNRLISTAKANVRQLARGCRPELHSSWIALQFAGVFFAELPLDFAFGRMYRVGVWSLRHTEFSRGLSRTTFVCPYQQ
jgi:hypothetical protein